MNTFVYAAAVLCAFVAVTTGNDTSLDKVDNLMATLERHYRSVNNDALSHRKKRQAQDSIRSLLRQVIAACSAVDPGPTPDPIVSPIDGPCTSPDTVNLTEWWRKDNQGSDIKPDNNYYACDRELQGNTKWFRFTGAGGSMLRDTCSPDYSCGGHGGFWSDAQMPTTVGEVKQVPIYGNWRSNCKWYTWPTTNPMTVQRCSSRPGDFVYKVRGTSSCYWTFCGMDV